MYVYIFNFLALISLLCNTLSAADSTLKTGTEFDGVFATEDASSGGMVAPYCDNPWTSTELHSLGLHPSVGEGEQPVATGGTFVPTAPLVSASDEELLLARPRSEPEEADDGKEFDLQSFGERLLASLEATETAIVTGSSQALLTGSSQPIGEAQLPNTFSGMGSNPSTVLSWSTCNIGAHSLAAISLLPQPFLPHPLGAIGDPIPNPEVSVDLHPHFISAQRHAYLMQLDSNMRYQFDEHVRIMNSIYSSHHAFVRWQQQSASSQAVAASLQEGASTPSAHSVTHLGIHLCGFCRTVHDQRFVCPARHHCLMQHDSFMRQRMAEHAHIMQSIYNAHHQLMLTTGAISSTPPCHAVTTTTSAATDEQG